MEKVGIRVDFVSNEIRAKMMMIKLKGRSGGFNVMTDEPDELIRLKLGR